MAGSRPRPSTVRQQKSAHGMMFFKAAFWLLVMITLSFFLGFFVIARMVPHEKKPTPAEAPNPAKVAAEAAKAKKEKAAAEKLTSETKKSDPDEDTSSRHKTVPAQQPTAPNGPTISPEEDGQKPETPESTGAGRTDAGQPRGHAAGESNGVQTPANPDGPTVTPDSGAPVKSGLFRVQLGVYSTRAKAEEAADAAADKGIKTSIRVITRGDRTLYRVQHSSHKDRQKAEAAVQKLTDLGLDASIVDPN